MLNGVLNSSIINCAVEKVVSWYDSKFQDINECNLECDILIKRFPWIPLLMSKIRRGLKRKFREVGKKSWKEIENWLTNLAPSEVPRTGYKAKYSWIGMFFLLNSSSLNWKVASQCLVTVCKGLYWVLTNFNASQSGFVAWTSAKKKEEEFVTQKK